MTARVKNLLVGVFGVWLALFWVLSFLTIIQRWSEQAALGLASLSLYGLAFGFFWWSRVFLREKTKRLVVSSRTGFFIIGWLAAMSTEILLYFTFSYLRGISLVTDLVSTTPTYLALLGAWWWLIRHSFYSNREIFFLGGLNGFTIELPQKILVGQSPVSIVVGAPVHVFIYGCWLLVPFYLFGSKSVNRQSFSKTGKYAGAILGVPLLVLPFYVTSILLLFLLKSMGV
jgi:hypothetical protein